MLVSSIGYLNSDNNVKSIPVKNKNTKGGRRFGQVQDRNDSVIYDKKSFKNIISYIASIFSNKNTVKNDTQLSLMA